MSELTLQLPETLHYQLETLAQNEGIPLNQYILYTLTRQVASEYTVRVISPEEVAQQKVAFTALVERLGTVSDTKAEEILAKRQIVEPESELHPETIERVKERIANEQVQL